METIPYEGNKQINYSNSLVSISPDSPIRLSLGSGPEMGPRWARIEIVTEFWHFGIEKT